MGSLRVPTEELVRFARDDGVVMRSGRFSLALAACVAALIAATVAAVSVTDQDSFQMDELLRVEEPPAGPDGQLEEQLVWLLGVFGGEERWTDAQLDDRFTDAFREGFGAAELNQGLDQLFADLGTIRFVRVTDREESVIRALGVSEGSVPVSIWVAIDDEGIVESLTLDVVPSPPRLPIWQVVLLLVAGWLFAAVAVVAQRLGRDRLGWVLLAASGLVTANLLVLSDSSLGYTIGRLAPAALAPLAIWLLSEPLSRKTRRAMVATAAVAAAVAALAPLTRDTTRIGHPAVVARIADDDGVHRLVLSASAALFAGVLIWLAVAVLANLRTARRPQSVHHMAAVVVAAMWAIGATGSAIDAAVGTGRWLGGAGAVCSAVAIAGVPLVVGLGLLSRRWDRPGLERLVIDLETDAAQLDQAVARALDDPTLVVLVANTDGCLAGPSGEIVDPTTLGPSRTVTEIRSGMRLVGALAHDAARRHDPERLEAVAAAAGMAIEVGRLNRRVLAQLDEVSGSRARIVEASDTARRQVARDLHDGAQQRLVALGIRLQRARRLAQQGRADELDRLLDGATADVRGAIDDIRGVSRGTQPALLAERGLAAAVETLVERSAVPVRVDIVGGSLPGPVATTAYFVIAEGLTNVAKHAHASGAEVTVCRDADAVTVRIVDDGIGGAIASPGSGLQGLDDRVAAAGGSLRIDSIPPGTTVEAMIPCA